MAQLYFKMGVHEKIVQFDHFFRNYPNYGSHKAGYCINAGLEWFVDWMQNAHFSNEDIELLKTQKSASGKPLFHDDFLNYLKKEGNFSKISLKAIGEGRTVHPHLPLTIVQGPAAMAQIMETALLNQLNFQTLVATKACRIKEMGKRQMLIEFGARRAQDRGAIAGVRAALIGGADYSSNVGISHILGYQPKGTHAHSMIQLFLSMGMNEEEAFQTFADLYPDDCILLVDTINTLESGIPNAIKVFQKLKKNGHKPVAIRLDSGDLAYLSLRAARMLDDAGLEGVGIVLSNELDEMNIWQIITQISEDASKYNLDADKVINRLIYGVGTKLITSAGDSALGGVLKLVAVKEKNEWVPALKISESIEKIPNPGDKRVWRIYDKSGKATADLITLSDEDPAKEDAFILRNPLDRTKKRILTKEDISKIEPLLFDIIIDGKLVYNFPSIDELRKLREQDIESLDSGVKRLILPHPYHVSLSEKLWKVKEDLIKSMKSGR